MQKEDKSTEDHSLSLKHHKHININVHFGSIVLHTWIDLQTIIPFNIL